MVRALQVFQFKLLSCTSPNSSRFLPPCRYISPLHWDLGVPRPDHSSETLALVLRQDKVSGFFLLGLPFLLQQAPASTPFSDFHLSLKNLIARPQQGEVSPGVKGSAFENSRVK